MRVDFHAAEAAPRADAARRAAARPAPAGDAAAAGAERDWLAGQEPGIAWLFPERRPQSARARWSGSRSSICPGQSVRLLADGRAGRSDRLRRRPRQRGRHRRGQPVARHSAREPHDRCSPPRSATPTARWSPSLTRPVTFSNVAVRAELVRARSLLVADGVTRPVIALRLTDRDGRPVHHGLAGDFEVPAPYYPAVEADAQQARQLAGLERARPVWHVEGEDGIAYVELEPTTASGSVTLRFNFRDGELVREQRARSLARSGRAAVDDRRPRRGHDRLQPARPQHGGARRRTSDDVVTDGRLALYARGRILGRWLMTLAYDSDKQRRARPASAGSSIRRLITRSMPTAPSAATTPPRCAGSICRLERPQFYALFGDYDTGIDEPELARYVRSLNGLKAEYRSDRVSATAFAADTPNRHRRDEIQGNGLSGPYALGSPQHPRQFASG